MTYPSSDVLNESQSNFFYSSLECTVCLQRFTTYPKFLTHNKNCFNSNAELDSLSNFSKDSFLEFSESIEIKHNVSLNKYSKTKKSFVLHCNHNSLNIFKCPFSLLIMIYNNQKYYIKNSHIIHNHVIDFNFLRLIKSERLAVKRSALNKESKKDILKKANTEFKSPVAQFKGKEYFGNLVSKTLNEGVSKKMENLLAHYNVMKEKEEIIEHVIKKPGEIIDDLVYPQNDLLLCFSFSLQMDFLSKNKI